MTYESADIRRRKLTTEALGHIEMAMLSAEKGIDNSLARKAAIAALEKASADDIIDAFYDADSTEKTS